MQKTLLLLSLAGAALLCGCGKQTRINTEEIKILSQQMVLLQQTQAKQMAEIQAQLTSLAPMLDKMNGYYFEKTHDDAFFYHTNTLFMLLTVDNKIESELQVAAADREADSALAYAYHTNELDMLHFYTGQIQDSMTGQDSRIEDTINAEIKRTASVMSDDLLTQIKLSAPGEAETTRMKQMVADVAQLKLDIGQIKAHFGLTNQPVAQP